MRYGISMLMFFLIYATVAAQVDPGMLTMDRIYSGKEFNQERMPAYQWLNDGKSYVVIERSDKADAQNIVKYDIESGKGRPVIRDASFSVDGDFKRIEALTLSDDESKLLLFMNSQRVWRSNTKGAYTIVDLSRERKNRPLREAVANPTSVKKLGKGLVSSSLMFSKFSSDNSKIAYVSDFNLYVEDYKTGAIRKLTEDGTGDIINGTFDWVYEEEFGCRDGFRWSPDGERIAYWQLDASGTGVHHMINNTDSVYSKLIPLQYPKVGDDPSACKVGIVDVSTGKTEWIAVPGDPVQHYIPRMQWIKNDLLMIQQLNRKQNHLIYYNYNPFTKEIKKVYEEREDTWVDIDYPDVSSSTWGMYDLSVFDDVWVTRMTEGDGWRHVYKINLETGEKILLTPGNYDVATTYDNDGEFLYFSASPNNSTQRYLWKVALDGQSEARRITPRRYPGINKYDLSPDGKYAFHTHSNAVTPSTTHLIRTSDHSLLRTYVSNESLKEEIGKLKLGETKFFKVTTEDDITIDGRMILPPDFDETKKYPVLFHVYGEPWGMVAQDAWVGMWEKYVSQQGYIIIDMDNRGTPCLNGSEWRKSIYRQIGRINADDQAAAAKQALRQFSFLDAERTAVWGWSGGGSMTLNLMFRYGDIYKTGISVAPVGNQLLYDNIYQERYMGLPQENREDFIKGSPMTYAKDLKGNLLLIHGTGDDNVHYQNAEVVINELIKHNRPFDMMAYPNRSHGIYEGVNTRKHLYTLITRYLNEHVEAGALEINDRP